MSPTLTATIDSTKVSSVTSSALTKLKQGRAFKKERAAEIDAYKIYFVKKFPGNCADVGIKYKFLGAALDKVNHLNFGIRDFFHNENKSYDKRSLLRAVSRNSPSVVGEYCGLRVFAKKSLTREVARDLSGRWLTPLLITLKMSKRAVTTALLFLHPAGRVL